MYASTTESPVLLVGTAHVVDLSVPLRHLFEARPFDAVALELDADRAAVLHEGSTAPGGGSGLPVFVRLWGVLQRRLGTTIGGGVPGAEMKVAAELAGERKIPVFLIDDPLRETVLKLVRTLPLKERVTLLVAAILGLFVPPNVVEDEMNRYSERPQEYSEELRRVSPTVARVLLDERNERMADRLRALRQRGFGRVVAIVGDAHLTGLTDALHRRGVAVEALPLRTLRGATAPLSSPFRGPRPRL